MMVPGMRLEYRWWGDGAPVDVEGTERGESKSDTQGFDLRKNKEEEKSYC